jgi:hypothetical protein
MSFGVVGFELGGEGLDGFVIFLGALSDTH